MKSLLTGAALSVVVFTAAAAQPDKEYDSTALARSRLQLRMAAERVKLLRLLHTQCNYMWI